jgi:hypothetical protein
MTQHKFFFYKFKRLKIFVSENYISVHWINYIILVQEPEYVVYGRFIALS